ncbi:MAG: helix-turn-helix domain-containing protein [Eubacteriales bacterium]
MPDLGKRIQELRKDKGITQQELAKMVKISHPQIVRYETKGVQPPADVLARIADAFDVSIDYLVNGDKSDKAQQTLKDAELIQKFKQLDQLPEEEKKSILKVISALLRDFNARQAYVM